MLFFGEFLTNNDCLSFVFIIYFVIVINLEDFTMFIFAQILGATALFILILSFQKNEKQSLLKYQIGSSIFFAAQYLCLQAYSGCLINIACIIRNILFRKYTGKRIPIYYLLFIICIMIVLSLFSYVGPISLLPCIACILYSCSLWQDNLRVTRIVEVISCSLYIIYNIKVLAYVGLISTIIELISALIAIYRFDIKKDYK